MSADSISCAGGCGKSVAVDEVEAKGWSFLQITNRYRCGACDRALAWACTQPGIQSRDEADRLPPDSIGALKKLPERLPLHEKVRP